MILWSSYAFFLPDVAFDLVLFVFAPGTYRGEGRAFLFGVLRVELLLLFVLVVDDDDALVAVTDLGDARTDLLRRAVCGVDALCVL